MMRQAGRREGEEVERMIQEEESAVERRDGGEGRRERDRETGGKEGVMRR